MNDRSFFSGLQFILTGFKTIKQYPHLKKWVAIPLTIDFCIFVGGIFILGSNVQAGVLGATQWLVSALSFLQSFEILFALIYYPFLVMAWIVSFLLWIYVTFVISSVVAAPFNALLAEKTLMAIGAIEEAPFKFTSWMAFTLKMLWAALIKAAVFAMFGIFLFICSFIPGLNIISSFGAMLIVAFDCCDYAYELFGMNFSQRLSHYMQNMTTAAGMAASLGVTVVLPGVMLLVLPLGVVGGSVLVASQRKS